MTTKNVVTAMTLTRAQQRVYDLVIIGRTCREMSEELHITEAAVKAMTSKLRQLFEVRSTCQLVALHYMGKEAFWEARSPWKVGDKVKIVGSNKMPESWPTDVEREVAIPYPSGIKCTRGTLYLNEEIQRIQ
ncbi:hypothetical protein ALT721_800037 [Alteromonas alvinellae]